MAYAARHPQWSKRLLAGSVAVCVVFAFLPTKYTGWLGGLGGFVGRVVAPVSHPATQLASWMAGGPKASSDDPALDELAKYETLSRRLAAENDRLRELIADLQAGVSYSRRPVTPIVASVISRSSDPSSPALTVRAGRVHGVDVNDIAVVRGVHVVGRVERVSARTSVVRPITDGSYGRIGAVIDAVDGEALQGQLEPIGGGLLAGPLIAQYEGEGREPRLPEVGATVRLSDSTWPESAQMLVLGTVDEIDRDPDQRLRYTVRVRPVVDLSRASEVIVRTSPAAEGEDS